MACLSQSVASKALRSVIQRTVRSIAACASPMAMAPSTTRSFWKLRMMA
jgi:hypothetical protein